MKENLNYENVYAKHRLSLTFDSDLLDLEQKNSFVRGIETIFCNRIFSDYNCVGLTGGQKTCDLVLKIN